MTTKTAQTKVEKELSRLKKAGATTDALELLERHFGPIDPVEYEKEKERCLLGCQIYEARTAKGLTQRQLAELVGTTASAICRLESADYDRYSIPTLKKIAKAVGMRIEVRFVPEPALK